MQDPKTLVERVARLLEEADTRSEANRLPWQDYAHMAAPVATEIEHLQSQLNAMVEALDALEVQNESRTAVARTDRELGVAGGVAMTLRQIRQCHALKTVGSMG